MTKATSVSVSPVVLGRAPEAGTTTPRLHAGISEPEGLEAEGPETEGAGSRSWRGEARPPGCLTLQPGLLLQQATVPTAEPEPPHRLHTGWSCFGEDAELRFRDNRPKPQGPRRSLRRGENFDLQRPEPKSAPSTEPKDCDRPGTCKPEPFQKGCAPCPGRSALKPLRINGHVSGPSNEKVPASQRFHVPVPRDP